MKISEDKIIKIKKENKIRTALTFYLQVHQLTEILRSGWDEDHWNITAKRKESIAEHSFSCCILALSLNSEFALNLNITKILVMSLLHDIGETKIGDSTPFDNISSKEKISKEYSAIEEIVNPLVKGEEFRRLLIDFKEQSTRESIFVHRCDKMQADIQSKIYQDAGCYSPLEQQSNNKVLKLPEIQKIIENGAKTAYDIWDAYDKPLYNESEIFSEIMDFLKKTNTQELI